MDAAMPSDTPSDSGRLLFTYGTLMLTTGIAAVDAATRDAGESLGRGYIFGRLFDLGEYPGAVAMAEAGIHAAFEDAPKVWGRLIRLKDPAAFYRVIDAYEGFDPAKAAESEFVRVETTAYLPGTGKRFLSQAYFYNLPIEGKSAIASGDYLAHWRAKGKPNQGRMP
jgi:gamma-glutamylcyclotransferase (GGCT)/AIG2-like uncharacterized protein YtfP